MEKYEARSDKSVFWLHCKDEHDGDLQKLDVGIACKRSSDAMLRQISEAVLIEKDDPDLNKRCEWGNRNVPWRKKEKGITSSLRQRFVTTTIRPEEGTETSRAETVVKL